MRDEWDWNIGLGCTTCGASLWEDDRAFSYAARAYLCQDCAAQRGGIFDAALETWTTPPDVRDIAPHESSQERLTSSHPVAGITSTECP